MNEAGRQEARRLFGARSEAGLGDESRLVEQTLDDIRQRLAETLARGEGQDGTQDGTLMLVDEILLPEFKAQVDALLDALADIHASYFTIDELRDLHAWAQDPAVQKMTALGPRIATESRAASQAWTERVMRDALLKHAQVRR